MLSARDVPLLPVFVAVATSGSFTAAARELRLAKSVISQHVRTLEERCGVRLIERSTRRLHLTQIGEQVFEHARSVLASVRALDQVIDEQREAPAGTLRVTAPNDHGLASVIAPVMAALMRRHDSLRVELLLDDAVHDLVREGLDVALRLGPLVESAYAVRRLGVEQEIIVGSPSLIDAHGADKPRELLGAPWVVHRAAKPNAQWTFRTRSGEKVRTVVDVRATVNSTTAMRPLLLEGAGFGCLPAHMVREELASGRLRRVCSGWYRRRVSLHALLPTRHSPPRARAFLAAIAEAIKPLGFESA